MLSRRQFLNSAGAGVGLALSSVTGTAMEPVKRSAKSPLRLSLAGYSFRNYLADDPKTKTKAEWTYDDFIEFAAVNNLDAVELTAYYFPETTPESLARLKGKCTRLGL